MDQESDKKVIVDAIPKDQALSDDTILPGYERHDSDVSDTEVDSLPMQIMPGDVGTFSDSLELTMNR